MLYTLQRVETLGLAAAYGGLWRDRPSTRSNLYCDIRVGNHQFDNVMDGGLEDRADERESVDWVDAPDDLNTRALQIALWKLTQLKFDEALEDYWDHRKALVSEHLRDEVGALTRERPVVHIEPLSDDPFPREEWTRVLVDLSRRFLEHPEVYDPDLSLAATRVQRWLVTSEGTRVLTENVYVRVGVEGWILTDDGVYVEGSKDRFFRSIGSVPGREGIAALMDEVLDDLHSLQSATSPGAVIGPALLSGQAAGTLFHEALGHRLEGERLIARGEAKTFAHKRGERILPCGLDVYDDPTIELADSGEELWGSYRIDDQGVRAQRALLVENGVLRGFLSSRTPLPGAGASNGHGRHDGLERPMARMGNLIIRSRDVMGTPWSVLRQRLIEITREQGRRHAIIIKGIRAGETTTSDYDFQVFKGELSDVTMIDVETGVERRIRDVELIGTPLAALQRIVGVGREQGVDQGHCYAESGSVPVSGLAPPILLSELELQQRSTTSYHEPLLPPPFADDGSRGRKNKLRERGRRRRRSSR
jgi:predicted Zn-dependent protease